MIVVKWFCFCKNWIYFFFNLVGFAVAVVVVLVFVFGFHRFFPFCKAEFFGIFSICPHKIIICAFEKVVNGSFGCFFKFVGLFVCFCFLSSYVRLLVCKSCSFLLDIFRLFLLKSIWIFLYTYENLCMFVCWFVFCFAFV